MLQKSSNPSCIDLILANRKKSFQSSHAIETGLSDFHKMVVTVMKTYFKKQSPKVIYYRNYKNFSNVSFRDGFLNELEKGDIEISRLDIFMSTALNVLEKHAPIKKCSVRGKESPFMSKPLKKDNEKISSKK